MFSETKLFKFNKITMRQKLLITLIIIFGQIILSRAQNISSDKLILKIKKTYKENISEEFIKNLTQSLNIKDATIKRIYPNHTSPAKETDKYRNKLIDLSLYYEMSFDKQSYDIKKLELILMSSGVFEYVEPKIYPELFYTPDDPYISGQYYLDKIQAYAAWDICKGDSTIVIGITDTGYDFGNPDLAGQVARKTNEPIDGIDNDFDGYIDNRDGWDFGDFDNNPQWNEVSSVINDHGVAVSGAASAATDNGTYIAGVGYKTRILPVKIMDSYGLLSGSYEGLVYAADQGCDVINCSWGSTIKSKYGQDMVNYATYNCNSLVIAAAGNSDQFEIFYPASYDNVISVAGTNGSDYKWTASNDGTPDGSSFGPFVDVCAPSVNVLVITGGGLYWSGRGTSIASPMVAGEAALIKAYYDTLSALQIGEVLRNSCDNIDTISFNSPYAGYLGNGRINIYRALTDTLTPAIRFDNIRYNGMTENDFIANDTIYITGRFTNYLTPTTPACNAVLSCNSPYIQIIQNTFTIGQFGEMDTINNSANPFIVRVLPGIDYNEQIVFTITYSDQNYSAFEHFTLLLNNLFYHIDTNNLELTVTSNGRLCYSDYYPLSGKGCYYNDNFDLMYYAGLMIGVNKDSIADFFSEPSEFYPQTKPEITTENFGASIAVKSIFTDSLAGIQKPNVKIIQHAYAWSDNDLDDCIFLRYQIINKNSHVLDSFYLGLYLDVDMQNLLLNTFDYDQSQKLAYAKSNDGSNLYTAIKLLSPVQDNFYAFDFVSGGFGGIDVTDGFSDEEKFQSLSTPRYTAGYDSINDIAGILSAGPITISAHDTADIMFSLIAGIHYQNIINTAQAAQSLYDSLFVFNNHISKNDNNIILYPNPTTDYVNINYYSADNQSISMSVINSKGKYVYKDRYQISSGNNLLKIDVSKFKSGKYYIVINNKIYKLIIVK
ncbi:MAG: hypothetical protein Kow0068_22540 [Marinilabiliales bacterium]